MKISIQSLKNGFNSFDFNADVAGIRLEAPEVQAKEIQVQSTVDKSDHNIVVRSKVVARVDFTCDSCLDNYLGQLDDDYTILYTSDKSSLGGEDEMVRLLGSGTAHLDLTEGLRESLILSLPMNFKCSVSCKGLCDQCGTNLNKRHCGCEKSVMDPRWEGLKKLLEDDSGTK